PVAAGAQVVAAPMPGKILSINAKAGDAVKRGDVLLILEAMKMQNEIMAPADGTVSDIRVSAGQTVSTGDAMVILG
ncbi:MAG: biotin/lipoyl-containing protein, partial [Sporomusa sp.]